MALDLTLLYLRKCRERLGLWTSAPVIQWKESMVTNGTSTLFHLREHKAAFMHADAMNGSMIITSTS